MQNRKYKKISSVVLLALVAAGVGASSFAADVLPAAVLPKEATAAATPAPQSAANTPATTAGAPTAQTPTKTSVTEATLQLNASGSSSNSNTLEDISKLRVEKTKLEYRKDIAKLKADLEALEVVKNIVKGEGNSPKNDQASLGGREAKAFYNSLTVVSIYGSGKKLNVEFVSNKGRIFGEEGTVLPTGEVVKKVTPQYVVLNYEDITRRLIPSAGDLAPVEAPSTYNGPNVPTGPISSLTGLPKGAPMPFSASDLLGPAPLNNQSIPQQQ